MERPGGGPADRLVASLLALLAIVLWGGFAGMAVLARAARSAMTEAEARKVAQEQTGIAQAQVKITGAGAERLQRQDYVSRVNLAYRECLDNNVTRALELLDGCPVNLRGWEWQYVWRQCHLAIWSVREPQYVHALAFSPDGLRIATGTGPVRQVPWSRGGRLGGARGRDRPGAIRSSADPRRRHRRGVQPRRSASPRAADGPDPPGSRHRPSIRRMLRAPKPDL